MSTCARLINIPGPRGLPGADGSNGAAGINPFTVTTAALVMPPAGDTVVAEVGQTAWMIASQDVGGPGEIDGQVLVLEFAGSCGVTNKLGGKLPSLFMNFRRESRLSCGGLPGATRAAPYGQVPDTLISFARPGYCASSTIRRSDAVLTRVRRPSFSVSIRPSRIME